MVGLTAALLALELAAAQLGTVANPDLDELSGLVVSRRDPTVLWGHNDTGAGPVLYRIGTDGADLGTVWIPAAGAGDWEDIAAFEDARGPALLIADVGDNLAFRAQSTLYAVRDPGRGKDAGLLWRLDFRFADGARDCEAVAVDPSTREILLVSKRDRPPRLYRLPLPARPPRAPQVAELLGTLPGLPAPTLRERVGAPAKGTFFHSPTALDIAADGRTAVVVTPRNAYRYRRGNGPWREALLEPAAAVVPLPRAFDQIEAGALSADGAVLYIGGEDRPGRFARIALPSLPARPQ